MKITKFRLFTKKQEVVEKTYTEKDLVSFGNYLLSAERDRLTEFFKEEVTHADLENWKKVNKY